MKWKFISVFAIISTLIYSCDWTKSGETENQLCDTSEVFYSLDIQPIIQQYCFSCHDNATHTHDINLEDSTSFFFYVTEGSFYNSVVHNGLSSPMPYNGKMDSCSLIKIVRWKNEGYPVN